MEPKAADDGRQALSRYFIFAVSAFLLYQLLRLVTPFLGALAVAGALGLTLYPLHDRLRRLHGLPPNASALLSTVLAVLLAIAPLVVTGWLLIREAESLGPAAQKLAAVVRQSTDPDALVGLLPEPARRGAQSSLDWLKTMDIDPAALLLVQARRAGNQLVLFGRNAARHAFFFLVDLALLVTALFFAFRDGPDFWRWLLQLIPMAKGHKKAVAERLYMTFQAVIVGHMAMAIFQGVLAALGFILAGLSVPFLLGAATFLVGIFPGSSVVTVPTALVVMTYDRGRGIFLLIWGVFVVGLLENLLKPMVIGSRARLPMMLLFFGMFGAVKLWGVLGLLLGPMIISAVLAFVEIYRQEYYKPN